MTPLDRFAGRVFDLVVELSPWLLLGALVVGLAKVLVPPRLAAAVVGQPGSATRVVRGPLLDPIAWLATAGMLGWWFLGATLASGALLTLAMTLLATKGSLEPASQADATAGRRTVRGVIEGALSALDPVLGWMMLSIFIAAIIGTLVPHESLLPPGSVGISLAYITAIGIAVPLPISASAVVPIAGTLIGAGFPPGSALLLMLLGPMTSAAALGVLEQRHGVRGLAVALIGLTAGSVGLGLAVDAWLPEVLPSCCAPEAARVQIDAPAYKIAAAGLVVLLTAAKLVATAQSAFRHPSR